MKNKTVNLKLNNCFFFRNTQSDEGIELVVTVMEAKELLAPPNVDVIDTFVRIYLVPDETGALQTKVTLNEKRM